MKKTLCSGICRFILKSLGSSVVQNVLLSISPLWALAGWCLSRCFLGGIMSANTSLWGCMISVTVLPVSVANDCKECIAWDGTKKCDFGTNAGYQINVCQIKISILKACILKIAY